MSTKTGDVIIVGGGVIGLSIAYTLAREGASVVLLDAGEPGQASAAAAGMLAPLAEATAPGTFVQLAVSSLRRWPSFVAQLQEDCRCELKIQGPGMMRLARTSEEEAGLCSSLDWQQALGLPLHRLNSVETRALEPALGPGVRGAVLSPEERHVEPLVLLGTLRNACLQRRVTLLAETAVTGIETSKDRAIAVQTARGNISGSAIVLALGAWSKVLGMSLGASLPVSPLRGQMLALGPVSPTPFRHTLYAHGGYLVPRPDGRIIAGATEEHTGFDARNTDAGIESQWRMASALVPTLRDVPRHSAWAGLRPVSPDGLPLLGRVHGWDNIHVATGHGRNGILLTPITGDLMAAHLLSAAPPPHSCDPARFQETD